jgi:hypothetical protein
MTQDNPNGGGGSPAIEFRPVRLMDCDGQPHDFHFSLRYFPGGVALNAFELRGGIRAGYEMQVIGIPDDDPLLLLARLIEKLRRMLSVKHLRSSDQGAAAFAGDTAQGRIEWDEDQNGEVPMLIIDGKEVTWRQFGRMLMTYEGWQFKLQIRDISEEF